MLSCDDSLGPHGQRMGFPRQEYWSGLPFPLPGHLPNPGIAGVQLQQPGNQPEEMDCVGEKNEAAS